MSCCISYATEDYYTTAYGGASIPDTDIVTYLRQASRHIDTLTYNRIRARGFDNLSPYQQSVIRDVVCMQAEFEYDNRDEINTILSSYSINGVSAQFGDSWSVMVDNGIAMRRDTYSMLCQTGLCCRLMR